MDATFWATIALVIFVGVVLYLKVPGMLSKSLDERADRIRAELEDARKLREEAQQLLAEYQRKRKEAEKEAADIVEVAKREAALLAEEAHKKTEEYVARRTALAEQKIGQAEREAVNEVRANAVDLAVEAARQIFAGKADAKTNADLFKGSVQELKAKLN
ncbi:F0F1 ATP synthase subunit B [Aminobacter sp. UC22_36]|jgi:F-type H+-transporting ATPase subunit b|uniref:F0F1 ATP synthase subunit B n=1 Tax=Aminobacter sp. UC22_36 TaxID=3374549 RepID=UPI003757AA5C